MANFTKHKNLLLIVVDCLAQVHLEQVLRRGNLPNFEYLRENAVWFSDVVTVCTHTSPAFGSLLTGYYPPSHGIKALRSFKLHSEVDTMPELFTSAGYETQAWVTGPLLPMLGLERGWNVYDYRDRAQGLCSDTGQKYLDWLRGQRNRGPWLIMLHLWELHKPRTIYSRYDTPHFGNNAYARALHTVDELIGEILANVNLETTYLVLIGDHGETINWRDFYSPLHKLRHAWDVLSRRHSLAAIRNDHGFHVYEDMIRVPLFIAGPGLPNGKRMSRPASLVDILPTCAHLAGLEKESLSKLDGINLLTGAPSDVERSLLVMTSEDESNWPTIHCVRTVPWKYWQFEKNGKVTQALFNLQNDPLESVNLISQEPERAAAMHLELTRLLEPRTAAYTESFSEDEVMQLEERLKDLGYL